MNQQHDAAHRSAWPAGAATWYTYFTGQTAKVTAAVDGSQYE
jgi:hypothetical protein